MLARYRNDLVLCDEIPNSCLAGLYGTSRVLRAGEARRCEVSELDRILERLREVPPVTSEPVARRPGEPGESRYQRHSAHLRDRAAASLEEESADGVAEAGDDNDEAAITVDLRRDPPDGDSLYQRRSAGLPRSEDVLPS